MSKLFLPMCVCLCLASGSLNAKTPMTPGVILDPLDKGYLQRARQMENYGNFIGVEDQVGFVSEDSGLSAKEREEKRWLFAVSLYQTGDEACVAAFRNFASDYPESPRSVEALLKAADYYFFSGDYGKALEAYLPVNVGSLDREKFNLYEYRKAYCLVRTGHFDEASMIFSQLESQPDYSLPSSYYLTYIDYSEGNYKEAYDKFEDVYNQMKRLKGKEREENEDIVPGYYLAQIDYAEGNYDKVIEIGTELLSKGKVESLLPETQRVVGLSYFKTGKYEKAKPLLLKYLSDCDFSVAPDVVYSLGVISCEEKEYDQASSFFLSLEDLQDAIGQSSCLYLGQIAVEQGDSESATLYFEKASKMDFDPAVTETALYDYIVARIRGGNVPFSSAVPGMKDFLRRFPHSSHAEEIEEYLAAAYYNDKDYSSALESVNRITHPSPKILEMKQKILFELGVEYMRDNKPAQARKCLTEAVSMDCNSEVTALSNLWLGEACYALQDYNSSSRAYNDFLKSSYSSSNRALALYNLGYAEMMQTHYRKAQECFAEAMKSDPKLQKTMYDDALLRLADTQYYLGDYKAALKNYNTSISQGASASDYATYRRAVMYGLQGDINAKLSDLSSLPSVFPGSKWIPDALLEKANTYSALGESRKAEQVFQELRKNYGDTPQARSGMLELAISYFKAGNNASAETAYREIIEKWPTSAEARIADSDLRLIYAQKGELDEYIAFLKGIEGSPEIDSTEVENLKYDAAQRNATSDNPDITLLERYIEEYPDGSYIPEALLLKATYWEEKGISYHEEALSAYRELEKRGGVDYSSLAYAGIMRTTDSEKEKLKYAALVKDSPGLPADVTAEAQYIIACGNLDSERPREAIEMLASLSEDPESLAGAKAAVTLGEYYLEKGDIDRAEDVVKRFTDEGSAHQYWLARGYVTLADIYKAQGKERLAIQYLRSLKENYPGSELDIRNMIDTRLQKWQNN